MYLVYRITVVRIDRPPERRTCTGAELRDAAYDLIRSEGGTIADTDHTELIHTISEARSMADIHGHAALQYRNAAITIRPHIADQGEPPWSPDPSNSPPRPPRDSVQSAPPA